MKPPPVTDAAPPPRARREEVTFKNGDVTLAGTVFVGAGERPHPGIVFLHGSGSEAQWASFYLAERFAARGFVALAFDKRGVGKSRGSWEDRDARRSRRRRRGGSRPAWRPSGRVARSRRRPWPQPGRDARLIAERIRAPAFVIASAAAATPSQNGRAPARRSE